MRLVQLRVVAVGETDEEGHGAAALVREIVHRKSFMSHGRRQFTCSGSEPSLHVATLVAKPLVDFNIVLQFHLLQFLQVSRRFLLEDFFREFSHLLLKPVAFSLVHTALRVRAQHPCQGFLAFISSKCQHLIHCSLNDLAVVYHHLKVERQSQVVCESAYQPMDETVYRTYRKVGIMVQYRGEHNAAATPHLIAADREMTCHLLTQPPATSSRYGMQLVHDTFLHPVCSLVGECNRQDMLKTMLKVGRRRNCSLYVLTYQRIGFPRPSRCLANNEPCHSSVSVNSE